MTTSGGAVGTTNRLAAVGALVLLVAAPIAGAAFVFTNFLALVTTIVGVSLAAAFGWIALTHRGTQRVVALVVAVVAFLAVVIGFVTALAVEDALIGLVIIAVLVSAGAFLARRAVGRGVGRIRGGEVVLQSTGPAGPTDRPVLLMNPKSGGGKVEKFDLVGECRKRGVEPIVLRPDDDWRQKAIDAVEAGATVLGAAGGDGTQALVATVAVEYGLPFVCIPAGTRNHFALDLGVDRDDVVGSLDAFVDGVEQRVDLGMVADRVFVNNVSLGVYGEIVQSDEYRDAKVRTAVDKLPDLLGPDGNAPELRLTGPDGEPRSTRQLVLISNNPYELRRFGGFGTRERMDTGLLGITTISVGSTAEAAQLTALGLAGQLDRFPGYDTWTAPEVEISADVPVATGIDGEFVRLDPPVRFTILPGVLRVRLAHHAPKASPAAAVVRADVATVRVLWNIARGATEPGAS
jgi:diacylglycerol kinase family enzyme